MEKATKRWYRRPESIGILLTPAMLLLVMALYASPANRQNPPFPVGNIPLPPPAVPTVSALEPLSIPIRDPFENTRVVPDDPTACPQLQVIETVTTGITAPGPRIQFNHFALLPDTPPGMTEVGIVAINSPPISEQVEPSALFVELYLDDGTKIVTGPERFQIKQGRRVCAKSFYRSLVTRENLTKQLLNGYRIPQKNNNPY